MNLSEYDPRKVKVEDKSPPLLKELLFHLLRGMAEPSQRPEDEELRDYITYGTPDGPPPSVNEPLNPKKKYLKTRKFGNASLDDYLQGSP